MYFKNFLILFFNKNVSFIWNWNLHSINQPIESIVKLPNIHFFNNMNPFVVFTKYCTYSCNVIPNEMEVLFCCGYNQSTQVTKTYQVAPHPTPFHSHPHPRLYYNNVISIWNNFFFFYNIGKARKGGNNYDSNDIVDDDPENVSKRKGEQFND